MTLHTAKGSAHILAVWLGCVGSTGLLPTVLLPARFGQPWWPFAAAFAVVLSVFLLVYPRRYIRGIAIRLERSVLQVETGVVWRSRQSVPLSSLRAVRIIQTPLQRRVGAAHVWLGFTGGMAWLPFVTLRDAEQFRQYWESH